MDSSNKKIDYKAEAQKGLLAVRNEGYTWRDMENLIDAAILTINATMVCSLMRKWDSLKID